MDSEILKHELVAGGGGGGGGIGTRTQGVVKRDSIDRYFAGVTLKC